MPSYELVLLFQKLERSALKDALKRSANYVFNVDGILRSIENLGLRDLPYTISCHGTKHRMAHVFVYNYDAGVNETKELIQQLKLDKDVVRSSNWLRARDPIQFHAKPEKFECTRHLDLLPPPLRPAVLAIQKAGMNKKPKMRGKNFEDLEFLI